MRLHAVRPSLCFVLATLTFLLAVPSWAGAAGEVTFTDWVGTTAAGVTGQLFGSEVTLSGPVGPAHTFDGTSTVFGTSDFTPSLTASDAVYITGLNANSYTLGFARPVQDPVFHVYSLASTIAFPGGTTVTKVSGDPTFTVADASVAGAINLTTDSSGTIRLTGTFTSLPFTATPTFADGNTPDGIYLQVGAPLPAPPSNSAAPSLTGAAAVGGTLNCDTGQWTGSPTGFKITWLRDGVPIPGANGPTYAVTVADQGRTLGCQVIATNPGGDSPPVTSAGTSIPAPPTPPPASVPDAPPAPVTTSSSPAAVAISKIATLAPAKACVSRRKFPIRLRGVKANKIVHAQIKLNGTQVRNLAGKALGLPIDLRGLPKGKFTIQIVTTDASGKRLVGRRTYRTCAPKRR